MSACSIRSSNQRRFRKRRNDTPWATRTRALTVFHGVAHRPQPSATIASTTKIICSMLPSLSLPTVPFVDSRHPSSLAHRVDQASPGCREGPIHPSGRRRDHSGVTSLSTFRHAIVRQHLPRMLSCHRSLQDFSVVQNDRVDNFAALHAALSGVVRQILAPLGDHESAAAWTTIRVVDSCPTSIRHVNRLLLCHCQRCTH